MDTQKKQRIALAALATLALGAGGWFFVFHDAETAKQDLGGLAAFERREREPSTEADSARRARPPKSSKVGVAENIRRAKKEKDQSGYNGRRERDRKPKELKKKKIVDAA